MLNAYYDKVYPALFNHPDFLPYFRELMNALQSTKINAVAFTISESSWDPAKRAEAFPVLKMSNSITTWELNIHHSDFEPKLTKEFLSGIDTQFVSHTWKNISTYNCKFTVAYNGRDNGKHKERTKSFSEWINESLFPLATRNSDQNLVSGRLSEYLTELRETNQRIIDDWHLIRDNEAYPKAINEALVRYACEKIKQVMQRYSWLGDETLRQGVQTFIVGEIMEL